MPGRTRLLLLDDDPDLLEIYREILQRLPGEPEIHVAATGTRALAMLESEPYTALITDLSMPKMDGLQVLAVVRRKWPQLKTAIMTSVPDEQFRQRARAMGVDLFSEKPSTSQEIEGFLREVGMLLQRPTDAAAPPAPRALAEIVQLECLSRNSSTVRVRTLNAEGRIWVQGGEVIDALTPEGAGADAFRAMMRWEQPVIELLPADASRARAIFTPFQELAQSGLVASPAPAPPPAPVAPVPPPTPAPVPVARKVPVPAPSAAPIAPPPAYPGEPAPVPAAAPTRSGPSLAELTRVDGVEWVVSARVKGDGLKVDSWGVEHPDELGAWTRATFEAFRALGEALQVGKPQQVDVLSAQDRISLVPRGDTTVGVGFRRQLAPEQARETLKLVMTRWAS